MKQKHLILALIAVLLIAILVIQNTEPVRLQIFFWSVNKPLILLIVVVALMAALASWFVSIGSIKESRRSLNDAMARIQELEKKLAAKPTPSPRTDADQSGTDKKPENTGN